MSDEFEDRMARWHKNYSEKLALWTPGNFAELARLHAENERLREALTHIASHYDRIYYPGELSFEFAEIARAALKGDSDE